MLKVLDHLLFRASEMFNKYLEGSGKVSNEMKYMNDGKFYSAICLLLCDLFGYRADLTANQFFAAGFSERKLIMCLDVYDILKKVRGNLKVNKKLGQVQKVGASGAVHASDEAVKEYSVVNHLEQVQTSV